MDEQYGLGWVPPSHEGVTVASCGTVLLCAVGLSVCCSPGSAQLTSALTDLPISLADSNINLWVLVDKFRWGCDLDSSKKKLGRFNAYMFKI